MRLLDDIVTEFETLFPKDAPTIFRLSGFSAQKSQWISGLNNIFYLVSLIRWLVEEG